MIDETDKDEVEAYDALLAIQYNGQHFRTRLQNMVRKADGTNGRTRRKGNAQYKLIVDEFNNPVVELRPVLVSGKFGQLATKVIFAPNGLKIWLDNKSFWEGKNFISEVVTVYTNYRFSSYRENTFSREQLDDGSYEHWMDSDAHNDLIDNLRYFIDDIGGHDTDKERKNCLVCQKADEYVKIMTTLIKDNQYLFKDLENTVESFNEKVADTKKFGKDGVFLPYSQKTQQFIDIDYMPKPLSTMWKGLKRTKRSVR